MRSTITGGSQTSSGSPTIAGTCRCGAASLATLAARWDEAQELTAQAEALALRAADPNGPLHARLQRDFSLQAQFRVAEGDRAWTLRQASSAPVPEAWLAAVAQMDARGGRHQSARVLLERLTAAGVTMDVNWLQACLLADVAAAVGDRAGPPPTCTSGSSRTPISSRSWREVRAATARPSCTLAASRRPSAGSTRRRPACVAPWPSTRRPTARPLPRCRCCGSRACLTARRRGGRARGLHRDRRPRRRPSPCPRWPPRPRRRCSGRWRDGRGDGGPTVGAHAAVRP